MLDLNHITISPDQKTASTFDKITMFQGESVILDVTPHRSGLCIPIPSDAYSVWSAWIDGAPNTLYIQDTGVYYAGSMRHELTPAESNLAAGNYKTQVQAFQADGTRMGVIANGDMIVSYSPAGSEPYVAPTGTVLADLVDVSTTAPTDTQVLAWDAASALWAPATSGGGSGDVTEVQVSGGVLTVSAGTGPVPIVGLTEAAIQTAAAALPLAGGTMTGALNVGANRFTAGAEMDFTGAGAISRLDMGDNKITSVGTPSAGTDAANKDYSDLKLPLAGGTLTGDLDIGDNDLTGVKSFGRTVGAGEFLMTIGTGAIVGSSTKHLAILDGSIIFNSKGVDWDFVVEGDTDPDLIHVDASTDKVGIGVAAPTEKLDVNGNIAISGTVTLATSATPSAPAAGSYTLYYDGTNLIGIDAAGVTTEIA